MSEEDPSVAEIMNAVNRINWTDVRRGPKCSTDQVVNRRIWVEEHKCSQPRCLILMKLIKSAT